MFAVYLHDLEVVVQRKSFLICDYVNGTNSQHGSPTSIYTLKEVASYGPFWSVLMVIVETPYCVTCSTHA